MDKDSILRNYKLAVLFEQSESRSWVFIKDEAELKRMLSDNEVTEEMLLLNSRLKQ